MQILRRTAGFTLVEMIVVLGIIGVLTALLVANFNEARTDAKNKAFLAELKEVQLALELYKSQNGLYPPATDLVGFTGGGCADQGLFVDAAYTRLAGSSDGCPTDPVTPVIARLTPEFITELPHPKESANDDCQLIYQVATTSGAWYKLTAKNCYEGVVATSTGLHRCASTCESTEECTRNDEFYSSPAIYNNGGACE